MYARRVNRIAEIIDGTPEVGDLAVDPREGLLTLLQQTFTQFQAALPAHRKTEIDKYISERALELLELPARRILFEINALAEGDWVDQPIGAPLTYGFRMQIERLGELLTAFKDVVPVSRRPACLRKYLSPRACEFIRAAQEVYAAEQVRTAEVERITPEDVEEQSQPLVFYGFSVPLPF